MVKKGKKAAPDFEPITLNLHQTGAVILATAASYQPGVRDVLHRLQVGLEHYAKREIRDYEAAILYVLAAQYNRPGAVIFEIGTCWGWSAAVMSEAAPLAKVITCTPNPNHVKLARKNLQAYEGRIEVREAYSVQLLDDKDLDNLALVFVDGDHPHVADDMPWFNRLMVGGLMFHHDYSPPWSSPRPCRWVWDTLNKFSADLRPPDVLVVDEFQEGLAGWYRQQGNVYRA